MASLVYVGGCSLYRLSFCRATSDHTSRVKRVLGSRRSPLSRQLLLTPFLYEINYNLISRRPNLNHGTGNFKEKPYSERTYHAAEDAELELPLVRVAICWWKGRLPKTPKPLTPKPL